MRSSSTSNHGWTGTYKQQDNVSGHFAPAGGHGSGDATSGASDAGGHGDGGHGDADATSGASN